jgi:hypothetical protein
MMRSAMYVLSVVVLLLILLLASHYVSFARQSTVLKILQYDYRNVDGNVDENRVENRDSVVALELLANKVPVIFMGELDRWVTDIEMYDYDELVEIFQMRVEVARISAELDIYELPLSSGWQLSLSELNENIVEGVRVKCHRYLMFCIEGEFRIIVCTPLVATNVLNASTNYDELECIEIVVRAGNMIYIPYNWSYCLFSNEMNNEQDPPVILCAQNWSYLQCGLI